MATLARRVESSIRCHRSLRVGQAVLVAVSGGLDSMVLLHLLNDLAVTHGWRLVVAHFNHGLRGRASNADEALVQRVARRLGWPCVVGRGNVRKLAARRKLSLEMAARERRHSFLARTARRLGISTVALAHHADDRVETFLLRLLRGAGCEGLAAMKPAGTSPADPRIRLVRPLFEETKEALRAHALERRIAFREDASNATLDFQRNRVRHELLPLLRRHYQPACNRVILRTLDLLGSTAEFVSSQAQEWIAAHLSEPSTGRAESVFEKQSIGRAGLPPSRWENDNATVPDGSAGASPCQAGHFQTASKARSRWKPVASEPLSRTTFAALPVALQRAVLQTQLFRCGVEPDYDVIEQLRTKPGRACVLSPSLRIRRELDGRIVREEPSPGRFRGAKLEVDLTRPPRKVFCDGVVLGWRFLSKATTKRGLKKPQPGREWFDAGAVGTRVIVRHWQKGDRFRPIGMAQSVKLQDWFTNRKIPRHRRHQLLLAATPRGGIWWIEGERIGEDYKVQPGTRRLLCWTWERRDADA